MGKYYAECIWNVLINLYVTGWNILLPSFWTYFRSNFFLTPLYHHWEVGGPSSIQDRFPPYIRFHWLEISLLQNIHDPLSCKFHSTMMEGYTTLGARGGGDWRREKQIRYLSALHIWPSIENDEVNPAAKKYHSHQKPFTWRNNRTTHLHEGAKMKNRRMRKKSHETKLLDHFLTWKSFTEKYKQFLF